MTDTVQCAGECRGRFDRGKLDDLGLCQTCGDAYYDDGLLEEDDEFYFDDEEDCYVSSRVW